ncbi:MAG: VTT domain-containing protein [ANME-2 cluster archaeon]|nr:VTT domain-containing protein [ANME-2 cluster archaeon]
MIENIVTPGTYFGIFVFSCIASSMLPIFLEPVVAGLPAMGFPLMPTVLVVSAGATLGSLTTYFIGRGSEAIAERFNKGGIGERLHGWFNMHEWIGITVVFLGALTPFPFEVVTFVAGFSRFPVRLYTLGCFLGKLAKFVILMLFGNALLSYFV